MDRRDVAAVVVEPPKVRERLVEEVAGGELDGVHQLLVAQHMP